MKSKFIRIIRKISLWTFASVLLIVIGLATYLYFEGENLTKRFLNNFVEKNTNNNYSLNYANISVSFLKQNLAINELSLVPKPSNNDQLELNFSCKKISFEAINLKAILFENQIQIKKLSIDKPVTHFNQQETESNNEENFDKLITRVKPFIHNNLKSISIDEIGLINAGIIENKKEKKGEIVINFDVGIKDFYTDSAHFINSADFFSAADVFLKIANYSQLLGDSLHQLAVKEISYSIKNKGILAQNISLEPVDTTSFEKTTYFVSVPSLLIHSDNIDDIFLQDEINLDSIEIKSAKIKVFPPEKGNKMDFKKLYEFDLYQVVKDDFKKLNIAQLKLNARSLSIIRNSSSVNNRQDFYNIDIQLDGFELDSASYTNKRKILYADAFDLSVGSYTIHLNDQVHRFGAKNILASSETQSIKADELTMLPHKKNDLVQTQVNLSCDSIRLKKIDLNRLFHYREMPLQQIAIYDPEVDLLSKNEKSERKHDSNSLLYQFIGNYIKGVYSHLIDIKGGKLKIREYKTKQDTGVIKTGFDFHLTDFSLDSISANKTDKLFFATNFDLGFSNYNMHLMDQLHQLRIDSIFVSSHLKRATIKNFHLQPNEMGESIDILNKYNKSELYKVSIPKLHLLNTNIHQAFFNKKLAINHFLIVEPDIYYESINREKKNPNELDLNELYGLLKHYIADIDIQKIRVRDGNLKLVNHNKKGKTISFDNKLNIELDRFRLNEREINRNRLLLSEHFKLTLKDYLFKLSDEVHFLQAKEIDISSRDSRITVNNAILYPDITSQRHYQIPRLFHVSVPSFSLQNINLREAFRSSKLNVKKLSINQPNVKIYMVGESGESIKMKSLNFPLPKSFQEFHLTQLELKNAKLSVLKTNETKNRKIAEVNIDLVADNVKKGAIIQGNSNLFQLRNINTTLTNFSFTPEGSDYRYRFSKLHYEKKNNEASLENLHVSINNPLKNDGLTEVKIPIVKVKTALKENKQANTIRFETVKIEKPVFTFNSAKSNNNNLAGLYNLKLNKDILNFAEEISAKKIDLADASVQINNNTKKHGINNVQVSLNNFKINERSSNNLLASDNIDLLMKDYVTKDKNNWYNIHFKEISLSTNPSKLSFQGINIVPKFSKESFQNQIKFQTDYYQGNIGQIELKQFDLKKYITDGAFICNTFELKNAYVDIYRDMRKKFNENQRPTMPQTLVKNSTFPFYFDSLLIKSSDFSYSEQLADIPKPGKIRFNNVSAKLWPVTNMESYLENYTYTKLNANALVMNSAKLDVAMKFDLKSSKNNFDVEGTISPFQLSSLNPMTKNAAQISIRSGQLNRFEFDFTADDHVAKGKLKFAYEDLKINILSYKDGNTKESKFASFLANSLMIKSKSPRTKILLPDQIYYQRNQKKSILNYWWKTVFSGVKNTFGLKENKE